MTTLHPDAANRRGMVAMSLAMAGFIANDALVKHVSESLPGPQLIFVRGVLSSVLLLAVGWGMGMRRGARAIPAIRHGWLPRPVALRSLIDATGTLAYLTALFHMPIGNATAINMASPLFMTLFVVVAWRETLRPARWVAVVSGFVGVLLVVQPAASGFNAWSLLCLLSALLNSARDLITRSIPTTVSSIQVTVCAAIGVTCASGLACAIQGWQPMHTEQFAMLALAGVFLSAAYYLVVVAMRVGEVSAVAPFRYTALLFALVLGWIGWGEVPNLLAWSGIALLLGAGLVMLRR